MQCRPHLKVADINSNNTKDYKTLCRLGMSIKLYTFSIVSLISKPVGLYKTMGGVTWFPFNRICVFHLISNDCIKRLLSLERLFI